LTQDRGLLVVLSGPSGVGKDTVLRRVFAMDPSLTYSVSYTTRAPRAGEQDDVDYTFVSDEEFQRMVDEGELLEWARVHNHRSGTGKQRVRDALDAGRDIILNIDVQGAELIRALMPDALFIFLMPPNLDELDRRRAARGTEDSSESARRAADAQVELRYADRYDAIVVNNDVEAAAEEVLRLIKQRRRGAP
jgi:guanylate kinase